MTETNVRSFIILQSREGLTSFDMNKKKQEKQTKKKTMKLSGCLFFLRIREKNFKYSQSLLSSNLKITRPSSEFNQCKVIWILQSRNFSQWNPGSYASESVIHSVTSMQATQGLALEKLKPKFLLKKGLILGLGLVLQRVRHAETTQRISTEKYPSKTREPV